MPPKKGSKAVNKVPLPNFEEPKSEFKVFESFYRGIGSETPQKLGLIPKQFGKPGIFEGLSFVTTGTMLYFTDDDITEMITSHGGMKKSSINSKTDVLLRGVLNVGPSKMAKAKELNVKIIDEESFIKYILSTVGKSFEDLEAPTIVEKELKISEDKLPKDIFPVSNLLTEKYRPRNIDDLTGNLAVIKTCRKFFDTFPSKEKALFIHGPPGVGKTTLAVLLAIEYGYKPELLNASDTRSKSMINSIYSELINSYSLDGKRKICIIFDEIDGMSSGDRGGLAEFVKWIDKSTLPIICICNHRDDPKFDTLAKRCKEVSVNPLNSSDIATRIKQIVKNENLDVTDNDITSIAKECKGDMRNALNSLQFASQGVYNGESGRKDVHIKSVSEALSKVIDGKPDIDKMFNLYFYDPGLIPIYVSESIKCSKEGDMLENLKDYANSLDSISMGNVIENNVIEGGFSLQYTAGLFTVVYPCKNTPSNSVGVNFPTYFRKGQTMKKISRWHTELISHIRNSYSKSSIFDLIDNLYITLTSVDPNISFDKFENLNLLYDDIERLHELYTYNNPNEKKKTTKLPNLKEISRLYKQLHSNKPGSTEGYYISKTPKGFKKTSSKNNSKKSSKKTKESDYDDYDDIVDSLDSASYDGEFEDPTINKKKKQKKKVLGYSDSDYE